MLAWKGKHATLDWLPSIMGSNSTLANATSPELKDDIMELHDPVSIYVADSNFEATLIQNALIDAGYKVHLMEDASNLGTAWSGVSSQIERPEIWVERDQADSARAFIAELDHQHAEAREAEESEEIDEG